MITVAGEALIDLIVDPAGHVDARFGGGPFNVVRAIARLGQPAVFLGRRSSRSGRERTVPAYPAIRAPGRVERSPSRVSPFSPRLRSTAASVAVDTWRSPASIACGGSTG